MSTKRSGEKRSAPRGSNLHWRADRGVWVWRKVDTATGHRLSRPTGQHQIALAMRVAAKFEDELREKQAGVKNLDHWRIELDPLIESWLEAQDNLPKTIDQKRRELKRAMAALRVKVAADLTDVAELDKRLRALERTGIGRKKLRRCYQEPLKQFSRWLSGNGRFLPSDPLRSWEALPVPKGEGLARRAMLPEEVARAFLALDVLDRRHGRESPQRPVFLALLVTAPRRGALIERDVTHLDKAGSAIDYGAGVGNKRRGAGALDPKTLADLLAYVGERKSGPLFLAPWGERYSEARLIDVWREAFALGVVTALWPADAPQSLHLAILVSRALITDKVAVSRGGNPKLVRPETVAARIELEAAVAALATRLRPDYEERMAGVDVHCFRATFQTWGEAIGVPAALIDRQLGHVGIASRRSLDVLRAVAGSKTGRKHYLDMNSRLLDAGRAAVEVRALLDEAEAQLGGSLLGVRAAVSAAPTIRLA